jgi:ribosomal-protein-serine acetyltransferase
MERPPLWTAPRPFPNGRKTPRLILRAWEPEDAAAMLAGLDAGRASFAPWLPWVEVDNRTLVECIFQIERMRREREAGADTNFVIAMIDRQTGAAVGGTGLHRIERESHQAEIGYWVRPDRRGEGLCTEAVAHLISWAFEPAAAGGWGLRRIEIACAAANLASQRVPRKLGMRQEVTRRAARFVPGVGWDDTLGWGVVREEWDAAALRVRPE